MNRSRIRQKMYLYILCAEMIISVFSVAENFIFGFPIAANIKWCCLLFVALLSLLLVRYKYTKDGESVMFWNFVFMVCLFMPFAFFDSGGSANNAIGYAFLLMISVAYFFKGGRRAFLVTALIVVLAGSLTVEYFHPNLVAGYSRRALFADRMVQTPLLLGAALFITLKFAQEYELANKKLNSIVRYDELTGLYNRRMFNRAVEDISESDKSFAHLALIDLDNFKTVNDKYGHHVGDEVLKKLAGLLRQNFELNRHIVSRWGGDEFAIIFFGDKAEFGRRLDAVRQDFCAYAATRERSLGLSVSMVSFDDYEAATQTFVAADRQLYKEKSKKNSFSFGYRQAR